MTNELDRPLCNQKSAVKFKISRQNLVFIYRSSSKFLERNLFCGIQNFIALGRGVAIFAEICLQNTK